MILDRFAGIEASKAVKAPVRVKTTANIALEGLQTINGVTLAAGDANLRVLVGSQTDGKENGIYNASTGDWTRAEDFDGNTDIVKGTQIYVQEGTQAGRWWISTSDPITLDVTSIAFETVSDNTSVIDNLVSTSTTSALSAKQGKTLKDLVDTKLAGADVVNDLTTGGAAVPLSATQGKALATKRPSVEKTASHTLALVDAGYLVKMNVGSANNLTVPPNSDVAFDVDTAIDIAQLGGGQTSIVAGSGVTIRSEGGKLKMTGQYAGATLHKLGTNEWLLIGNIAS